MKSVVILLFFFQFNNCTSAQTAEIDSVNRLIQKATSDTQRINLFNKIIYALSEINIDSSNILANKIIEDSKKINYKEGEANTLRLLAANFARQGDYAAAEKNLNTSAAITTSLGDSIALAKVYATYGMIYGMQSKYDTSIQFYQKSIGIDERQNNTGSLSTDYGNIAICFQMQSNFSQALIYQLKSLKIAEQQNDFNAQAYTQMNLGNTYDDIGDTLRAEKAFLKGIELAKSIGIKNVELYGYSNMASLYATTKRWNESYKYAKQSAELAKAMGDAGIESASLSKAAIAQANMQQFSEAEILNKNAMAIADSSKQPFNIFQAYSGMGAILKLEGKYKNAILFFEKGIQMLSSTDLYDESIQGVYADLSICYEQTGDYSKALSTFKTAIQIEDSIKSKENIKKTTELVLNNEFEKKQVISDGIQNKKNAEARLKQILLLSGLVITLVVAAGAWWAVRNKQKANQVLQNQKEEIQNTLSQLKATQAQLIQSEKMASLGELTAGIAHEIQNPLNFVNNFSEVNKELLMEMKDEMDRGNIDDAKAIATDVINNEKKINHHGKRADAIVKGMLLHSRSSTGVKEATDINKLADEYLRLSYHGLRAKDKEFNVEIKTDFDKSIGKINIIPQDIGRVLLNLYNNAFYAVSEKKKQQPEGFEPTISVSTKKSGNNITITVSDNGNGIPQKVVDKIFQPFFTTKPTGQGTGLGLSLSYDIIKAHGGEIKVETRGGDGCEFIILLAINS